MKMLSRIRDRGGRYGSAFRDREVDLDRELVIVARCQVGYPALANSPPGRRATWMTGMAGAADSDVSSLLSTT